MIDKIRWRETYDESKNHNQGDSRMNEEVRGILKKAYRGGLSGYEIGTQYEICLLNETEREITTLIKQANNDLAMKLTHEHNRNHKLEKVVEAARDIKSVREEYRGNIDAEAFYYFGNAVVDLIDSKLNQALKELE